MAGELTQSQEVHTTYDFTTKLHKLRDGKLMIIFSPSISSALWRWPTIASACSLRCLVAWVEFGEIQQAFSRGILEQSSKQSKKFKARPLGEGDEARRTAVDYGAHCRSRRAAGPSC